MDRKGKRKIEHIIVLDKGESSTKKNSQRNRTIVHEGRRRSSSSVQENQSAPVANPTNVSISTTTAPATTTIRIFSDGRRQRPIQFRNRAPRTFSNSSTTTALGGQETVVAEGRVLPPPQPEAGTTSSSRNQRTLIEPYLCKNCSRPFSNVCVLLRHEPNLDIDVGIQSRSRTATPHTQNNNFSARLTSPQLGFDSSHAIGIPPIQFKSYTHELNEIGLEDIGGRNTRHRRLIDTNLSLSNSEINDDGSIDLLSRVGRSNSLENQDHDHDRNNGVSDEIVDLLSRVGLNPSE